MKKKMVRAGPVRPIPKSISFSRHCAPAAARPKPPSRPAAACCDWGPAATRPWAAWRNKFFENYFSLKYFFPSARVGRPLAGKICCSAGTCARVCTSPYLAHPPGRQLSHRAGTTTGARQRESSREAPQRLHTRSPSGILYPWTGLGKMVRTGMYQYVPVQDGTGQYKNSQFVHTGTYF